MFLQIAEARQRKIAAITSNFLAVVKVRLTMKHFRKPNGDQAVREVEIVSGAG